MIHMVLAIMTLGQSPLLEVFLRHTRLRSCSSPLTPSMYVGYSLGLSSSFCSSPPVADPSLRYGTNGSFSKDESVGASL